MYVLYSRFCNRDTLTNQIAELYSQFTVFSQEATRSHVIPQMTASYVCIYPISIGQTLDLK